MKASKSSTACSRSGTAPSPADLDALRAVQLDRLRNGLRGVLKSNSFWRERLAEVHGRGDLARPPRTTQSGLGAGPAPHPPLGSNLPYQREHHLRLHHTPGSTGAAPLRPRDTRGSW